MPRITIPEGSPRDGSTLMFVNGEEALVPDNVPTDVGDEFVALLDDIGISYSVASGDFTNISTSNIADGIYTIGGSTVMFEDIVDLGSDDTTYNPANVDGDGIFCEANGSQQLALNDPPLTDLLTGFTVVFDLLLVDAGQINVFVHNDDYGLYSSATVGETSIELGDKDGNTVVNTTGDHLTEGDNKIAITFATDRLSVSINGRAVISGACSPLDVTMSAVAFGMSMGPGGEDCRLRSFSFYAPVDDADLPSLSAL